MNVFLLPEIYDDVTDAPPELPQNPAAPITQGE